MVLTDADLDTLSPGDLLVCVEHWSQYMRVGDIVTVKDPVWIAGGYPRWVNIQGSNPSTVGGFRPERFERYTRSRPKELEPIDDTEVKTIWY